MALRECIVHMGEERRRIEHPEIALAYGVYGGVAIGILNKKKGLGYIGNYPELSMNSCGLIRLAVKDAESVDDLEIVAVGNVPPSENYCFYAARDYNHELSRFADHRAWLNDIISGLGIKDGSFENMLSFRSSEKSYEIVLDMFRGMMFGKEEFFLERFKSF